jgi:limonene-1,2-epoxide hydrolase
VCEGCVGWGILGAQHGVGLDENRGGSMGSRQEAVVRSWIDCFVAQDLDGIVDLYSDDAAYHVAAWREPVVGRDAIRAEIAQQFERVSDDEISVLSILSTDEAVFFEAVDNFNYGGTAVTLHWASVWDVDIRGKIGAQRDYWDAQELKAQLTE